MALRETVSDVLLETLYDLGVRYLFANIGTDYPPVLETLARYAAEDKPLPQMVICPHENTAITAAHGYALATRQGQAVLVHVGVGTQNLGGALHNAWCGRIPLLVFAGRSPLGTRGERQGARDNPIHFFQDVRDQAGVIRQFSKWEFTLEAPEQSIYALQRGWRLMHAEPRGAIYVTAARETLDMPAPATPSDAAGRAAPPSLGGLAPATADAIVARLRAAERPLIVTSYLGRDSAAVDALVGLSETLGVPVVEGHPTHLNFPRTHPHHWGFAAERALPEADLVLLIDTDVPWMAGKASPGQDVPVIQLDVDPAKGGIVMWDFPVTESHQVDSAQAVSQLLEQARSGAPAGSDHAGWLVRHRHSPRPAGNPQRLSATRLSELLGELLPPETVIFDETISNHHSVWEHTGRTLPGTYFGLPASSLGWGGGAAMGHKLARPDLETVWLVGDGSFIFSVPTSLYMTAQRYRLPFLTVIYNNAGWGAVKKASMSVYGASGDAARQNAFHHELPLGERLEEVARAFGCFTATADTPDAFRTALTEARAAVARGTPAVINALLADS